MEMKHNRDNEQYIWIYEYCFTSLSAQSWQYRDRRKPEAGTMPYSYFEWLQGFLVRSTIGSTVHYMPLNSLEHCICTATMTNIHPDRDSNLVPPGYKPQSIRMSRDNAQARQQNVKLYSQGQTPATERSDIQDRFLRYNIFLPTHSQESALWGASVTER